MADIKGRISKIDVRDIRFPTSLEHHGSDAMVRHLTTVPYLFSFVRHLLN